MPTVRLLARLLVLLAAGAGSVAAAGPEILRPARATTAAAPEQIAAQFAAIERPQIVGRVDAPRAVSAGRATIVPAAGTPVFVFAAGDKPCGLLVDGPATLTYRVDDAFSVPVARRNLKRVRGFRSTETGASLTVTGDLRGAAVWGWDLDAGPFTPQAGTDLPGWLREWMARKLGTNPGRDMLQSAAHGDAGYQWAALHGTGDDFELDVDPRALSRTEVLLEVVGIPRSAGPLGGRQATAPLIAQPVGQRWWDPVGPDFIAVETELDVRNPAGLQLAVRARSRVQSQRDGLRLLSFSLMAEQPADRNVDQGGAFTISSLTLDGAPAPYVRAGPALLVEAPRALRKGESVTLDLTVAGEVLVRPEGDRYWRLGTTSWYPVPSYGGLEWASFKVGVEVAAPFVPVVAGDAVSREATPESTRVVTTMKGPMTMPTVVAGAYKTHTESAAGLRVHVSSYAVSKSDQARRLAGVVGAVRGCLEDWLGVRYPFQDLQLVEVREWGWGQAPPALIFLTQEAFISQAQSAGLDDGTRNVASQASRGINERVAHEVAHGWFPHVAKIGRPEDAWLSESLSDYVSAVCLERVSADRGRGHFLFERRLSDWKFQTRELGDGASVYLATHLAREPGEFPAYFRVMYGKGPLVLHGLRQALAKHAGSTEAGDRLFLAWVRAIVRNFTYKLVETRQLVAILNQMTNANWQPWFERYVYGSDVPEVK